MVNLHKIAQTGKACIPARILEANCDLNFNAFSYLETRRIIMSRRSHPHLRSKKHKIFKDHSGYKDILKDFKAYDPSAIPEQLIESPKKNFRVLHKVSVSLTGT